MDPPAYNELLSVKQLASEQIYMTCGGGIGYFGANFTVVHCQGCTVWIDVGIGFENKNFIGTEKTLPNLALARFFTPDYIILTHAHEDHIGAFVYMYQFIQQHTKIITSRFTYTVLKQKIKSHRLKCEMSTFKIIENNQVIYTDKVNFHIFFIPHSTPDTFSLGLTIKNQRKKLYFSSDFKIKGEEERFLVKDLEDFAPVDYLFCDSTGSLFEGLSRPEVNVIDNIMGAIRQWPGRTFVTTFSSNIYRIGELLKLAEQYGIRTGILGRSMLSYINAAFESGLIHKSVTEWQTASKSDPRALWLVAGCQCNEGSSLFKLAKKQIPSVKLGKNDQLLYSSRIIPSNTENVYECLNELASSEVNIMGIGSEAVKFHTSGHGKIEDIRQLASWLQPKNIVPMHGDVLHLRAFKKIFPDLNIPILDLQYVYSLRKSIKKEFMMNTNLWFVENNHVHNQDDVFQIRNHMAKKGICNVIIHKQKLVRLDYQGVILGHLTQGKNKIYEEIDRIILRMQGTNIKKREKKLKEKVHKIHSRFFIKVPLIHIIWID